MNLVGGTAATYDARGNLTGDPANGNSYAYTSENLLRTVTTAAGGIGFLLDPFGRRWQMAGGPITDIRDYGGDYGDSLLNAPNPHPARLRRGPLSNK